MAEAALPVLHSNAPGNGGFGLVNEDGNAILSLDPVSRPEHITAAICAPADVYPVSYAGVQAGDETHSTPVTAENFKNIPGQLFRVSGQAPSDEACFLTGDSVLITAVAPAGRPQVQDCPSDWIRSVATAKHLEVTKCWPVASGPADLSVIAAQFAPEGDSILASFVLMDHGSLFFLDFPTKYYGPDNYSWRVDDQGVFNPGDFRILFLARVRGAWMMALTWAGAEGEDAFLEVADSTKVFRQVTMSYRYWVPS